MHIELIGCTSAGKSTLARDIMDACRKQGIDILLGNEFVLKQIRLNWVKGHLLRTLLVDLAALVACLVTWRTNLKFYLFAAQLLLKIPMAPLEKVNLLRNVLKKVGIYEIIRFRSREQQLILVDEGILQAAHNLFVHLSANVKLDHLPTFVSLIPLPDVVVYLRQPESLLIERTMTRGHNRIPDRSYSNVAPFIKQALITFERLVQNPAVKNKLLIVDGDREVTLATDYQNDPSFGIAVKIIQNGMTTRNYESL